MPTSVKISQIIRTILSAVNVWHRVLKNQSNLKVSSLLERYENENLMKQSFFFKSMLLLRDGVKYF